MMITRAVHRRRAITRIEIIVGLLLTAVIVGVFIAFVRLSWDNSHLVVCRNNLKQIGDAIKEFEEKNRFLPAACIEKEYATWAVQIAPFVGGAQDQTLAQWQAAKSYFHQTDEVRKAQAPQFFCPQRRQPIQLSKAGDVPSNGKPGQHFPGALGDYACVAGSGSKAAQWDTPAANGAIIIGKVMHKENGRILKWRGRTDLSKNSLPRGQTKTIIAGEKHVPLDGWGHVVTGDGSMYNGAHFGSFARMGGEGHGIATSIESSYQRNFGSYHFEICHFLYADGHVEAHSAAMSQFVLGKLCNRHE